ncbi:MAG: hypothetical protein IPJ04_03905 [Candidatus Eisenbacteria bacterium]|nr:hypothetical protein [Candidatus Eisenbacteria bacterium]
MLRRGEYDANNRHEGDTRRLPGSVEVVSVGAYDAQDRLLTSAGSEVCPEEGLAAGFASCSTATTRTRTRRTAN